ncbi:MAG: protein kinase family protein [Planctomycetales bacterium]|nr:protein kinase family protein [Planctomycetales bacterium]
MSATWPHSTDYIEAVQAPAVNFADPDLRSAEVVTNAMGLPQPCSGNFADVYQFRASDGHRSWAVKCFTRPVSKLSERYREISQHLEQARLPVSVEFKYIEQGVRIRGQWYPVVKMDWVEGQTLRQFIVENLQKPRLLNLLFQVWLKVEPLLRNSRTAHGDLQHGNVMLVPGSTKDSVTLKLIDYDGMWVPSLAEQPPGEIGHPAYQHPERAQKSRYTPDVDRFPHLVIACALKCLSLGGAALWSTYDNSENLLFTKQDFDTPSQSKLLRELWDTGDSDIQTWIGYLIVAARLPMDVTPVLSNLLVNGRLPPLLPEDEAFVRESMGLPAPAIIQAPVSVFPKAPRASVPVVESNMRPESERESGTSPTNPEQTQLAKSDSDESPSPSATPDPSILSEQRTTSHEVPGANTKDNGSSLVARISGRFKRVVTSVPFAFVRLGQGIAKSCAAVVAMARLAMHKTTSGIGKTWQAILRPFTHQIGGGFKRIAASIKNVFVGLGKWIANSCSALAAIVRDSMSKTKSGTSQAWQASQRLFKQHVVRHGPMIVRDSVAFGRRVRVATLWVGKHAAIGISRFAVAARQSGGRFFRVVKFLWNASLGVLSFYASHRIALWEWKTGGDRTESWRPAADRSLAIPEAEFDGPRWQVKLPSCCVVCGDDAAESKLTLIRQVADVTWTARLLLMSLVLLPIMYGFILKATMSRRAVRMIESVLASLPEIVSLFVGVMLFFAPLVVMMFIVMLIGRRLKRQRTVEIRYSVCPAHVDNSRYPESFVLSSGLLLRFGNGRAKIRVRKFRNQARRDDPVGRNKTDDQPSPFLETPPQETRKETIPLSIPLAEDVILSPIIHADRPWLDLQHDTGGLQPLPIEAVAERFSSPAPMETIRLESHLPSSPENDAADRPATVRDTLFDLADTQSAIDVPNHPVVPVSPDNLGSPSNSLPLESSRDLN